MMIEELEKKLEELFNKQGIGKCTERWKSTTKYATKTEEAYIEAKIKTRWNTLICIISNKNLKHGITPCFYFLLKPFYTPGRATF